MKQTIKNLASNKLLKDIDNQISLILGDELPILSKLKKYTTESGGKRVRSLLSCYLSSIFENDDEKIFGIAGVIEIIHAASLLHDDVLDDASTRRGKPSGKTIFGSKEVILGGDYMLSCAIRKLNEYEDPRLMDIFTRVIKDLSIGELLQMENIQSSSLSLETYNRIIYCKTASLFKSSCEAVGIVTRQPEITIFKLSELGEKLGILFQIRDDYLDYFNAKLLNKPPFQDFENGFFTYPVLCIENRSARAEINSFFSKDAVVRKEEKTKKELLQVLKDSQSNETTLHYLNTLYNEIKEQLDSLPDSPAKGKILDQIAKLMNV